jgi:hypothetical protein
MPELDAQLLGLIAGGGYEGPGQSPDRADAMVWGLTELMLGRRAELKIWQAWASVLSVQVFLESAKGAAHVFRLAE